MTLPSSGPLTIQDVNTEAGRGTNTQTGLDWIKDNTKDNATSLGQLYDRAYYQRNNDGNCDNGNCTSNCNCGNIQCNNCLIAATVNCTNCDAQSWLQGNCNCACTYNCTTSETSYNCNCACACACFVCACACW